VTAEFATAMPAVILVLIFSLAGGQLAAQQVRLQDAAASAARSASRGETPAAVQALVQHLVPRASVARSERDGLVCATVTLPGEIGGGFATAIPLAASSCALAEPD
jgi:hypothetical protein